MIPVRIARVLYLARAVVRTAIALGVVLAGIGIAVLVALPGCGASALAVHARAATVAVVALEGVEPLVRADVARRATACPDMACIDALDVAMEPDLRAADEAVTLARGALGTYVESIQLALAVGEDDGGAVLSALAVGGARLLSMWEAMALVLRRMGIELPTPPLLGLAAGGGGS